MKRQGEHKEKKNGKRARKSNVGSKDIVNRTDIWPPIVDKSHSTGAEKKYRDTDVAIYQVNTTGSITLLNAMARGTDAASERVGRKVTVTSIYVRGYASTEISQKIPDTTPEYSVSQMVRCLIVYDAQPNAATPALTDILKEARPESQLNINSRDRFSVLADWDYAFGPMATYTNGVAITYGYADDQSTEVKIYRGGLRLPVIFNSSNAGTIADIATGAIFMVWVGNVAAGTNTDSNARVSCRVRYLDA